VAQFRTARLLVRRWRTSDDLALFDVYGDIEGARYVGNGEPITEQECQLWLRVTTDNYKTRGYGMFAIDELSSKRTVGFCGIVHPGGQDEPEVKYAFLKSEWRRGLASEVVPALLSHAHINLGMRRIIATVAPENIASQRVLEQSGLQQLAPRIDEHGATELLYEWIPRT